MTNQNFIIDQAHAAYQQFRNANIGENSQAQIPLEEDMSNDSPDEELEEDEYEVEYPEGHPGL